MFQKITTNERNRIIFIARLIHYKDNNSLLNLVTVKHTVPIQNHHTSFIGGMGEWAGVPGIGSIRVEIGTLYQPP